MLASHRAGRQSFETPKAIASIFSLPIDNIDEGDTFFQTSNILENEIQSFGQILVLIVRGYVWHNDKIIGGPQRRLRGEGLRFENIEYSSGQGASFQCGGESVIVHRPGAPDIDEAAASPHQTKAAFVQ
jgi:hypothetical protein